MKKSISFIIPAYNSEKTIISTIDSILSSRLDNYTVIVVDDHSSDNTYDLVRNSYSDNDCVKVFVNDKKGVGSARNYGITKSNSDYIMFIDSDDQYLPGALEKIVSYLEKGIDLFIFGYKRFMVHNEHSRINSFEDEKIVTSVFFESFIKEMQDKCYFNQIWNKVYISDILKKNEIYFDSMNTGEDLRFNLDYFRKIQNIKCIPIVGYKYFSTMSGLNFTYNENTLMNKINNVLYEEQFFIDYNYDLKYIDMLFLKTCFSQISKISKFSGEERKKYIYNYLNNVIVSNKIKLIKSNTHNIKLKILSNILLIKSYFFWNVFISFLSIVRNVYRKAKYE